MDNIQTNNTWRRLEFHDALPRLAATYNKGKLVPFTGAGISTPCIPGWREMIACLCTRNDLPITLPSDPTSAQLIKISEEVVTSLIRSGRFTPSLRECLGYKADIHPAVSDQCQALCEIWWPLVMTTNYDRMFADFYPTRHQALDGPPLSVFGRSPADCHSLLSSLHNSFNTAYWALQGYFGESINKKDLEEEIVVGYQQYRSAAFSSPTFRAVFGDVFRNYSFLFIGSGLTEDYFTGLFGEVLERFGGNPSTHCALFNKDDEVKIDSDFLHKKLNIVPIFYRDMHKKYDGLPIALRQLGTAIKGETNKLWRTVYCTTSSSQAADPTIVTGITLSAGPMPPPKNKECSVFSAGINNNGLLLSGKGVAFIEHCFGKKENELRFHATDFFRCWRYEDTDLYAAVARNDQGSSSHDARDLREVSKAVYDTLCVVNGKYEIVNMMLLAAGKGRVFRPVYSLISMIRGYKSFVKAHTLKSGLVIHIVDPAVLRYMRQQALTIGDLLNCEDMLVNIEIRDVHEIERLQIYLDGQKRLSQISAYNSIGKQHWDVRIDPLPFQKQKIDVDATSTIEELGVVPGSTIIYTRKIMP